MISWYDKPNRVDEDRFFDITDKWYFVFPPMKFINPTPGQITDLFGGYVAYHNPTTNEPDNLLKNLLDKDRAKRKSMYGEDNL